MTSTPAPRRIHIGKVPVDAVDLAQALDVIESLVARRGGGTVFTPNVDHIVVADTNARFREAYAEVSLSLVDGTPVLWASRWLGSPLPQKVSGSDLVRPLMQRAAARGYRVYFLGGDPGVAQKAKEALEREFSGIEIVGVDDARINPDAVDEAVLARIEATRPDLLLVALGAPKQELFCKVHRERLKPAVMICVGAGLDFVAGVKERAPAWVSRAGLEWLYRLAQEPRRLGERYLLRDPKFLWIFARQWLKSAPGR